MENEMLPEFASRERVSIADIHIEPEMEGSRAAAWIHIEVDNHTLEDQQLLAAVVVKLGDIQEKIEVFDCIEPQGGVVEAVIRIDEPELWWPHGFGEQTLYTCMVGLTVEGEVQDVMEQRFGIRDARLVQAEDTTVLLVNGEEIVSEPAVWAPEDQFVESASRERYQKLVQEAKDAGAIMIKAWGHGSEEDSAFYDECDEQGMLVWQELVPGPGRSHSDELADMVTEYLTERVMNLRNHPSIVVWCGSSEEGGQAGSVGLLEETAPKLLKELDRARPYLPHCPETY